MKDFYYNIIKELDENDDDLQFCETMKDGTQLLLPLSPDEVELSDLIKKNRSELSTEPKAVIILKALKLIKKKMPDIYINMEGYIKSWPGTLVKVDADTAMNFWCFSSELTNGKIPIAWNNCDICGYIASYIKELPYSKRLILLSQKTHITNIEIERNEDGDIVITPAIVNK